MEILNMQNISKVFPNGTVALKGVDFYLNKGEILSLLGENGAGKTTLMKLLYGMIHPNTGTITYKGNNVRIKSPRDAIQMGICMVHQHFMLVPAFTVLENIIIGEESCKGIFLDMKAAHKKVSELISKFNFNISPDALVSNLSVGEQQRVEILKALYRNADILILDEPTAVLTPHEVGELFVVLKKLKEQGTSIVIITHKLRETMALADRIAVLRDGVMMENNVKPSDVTIEELSALMVGRQIELAANRPAQNIGEVCFDVKNLNLTENGQRKLKDISFNIHKGEILGVAGIEGNGQTQLLEALTGLVKPDTMELTCMGQKVCGTANTFLRSNIGHVPEDRLSMGLVSDMSIKNNMILGYHRDPDFCYKGFLKDKKITQYAQSLKEKFGVKAKSIDTNIGSLSGGNQQKVIIARTFSQNPDVLIIAHPTRGVDIGAQEFIHHQLLDLRDSGKAVLLVSADLDEVRSVSDRLLVLYEGEIVTECATNEYTEIQLGMLMTGSKLEAVKGAE